MSQNKTERKGLPDEELSLTMEETAQLIQLLQGRTNINVDFIGDNAVFLFNSGEEQFRIETENTVHHFTSVEMIGNRSYFLISNSEVVMTVDFTGEVSVFEKICHHLYNAQVFSEQE